VKDVPANATAVGIPARILEEEQSKRRAKTAQKIGFAAYAVGNDENDPMIKAIHSLLDHAAKQDSALQALQIRLDRLNMDVETDTEVGEAFDVQASAKNLQKSPRKSNVQRSPTAHREAETAKAHRG